MSEKEGESEDEMEGLQYTALQLVCDQTSHTMDDSTSRANLYQSVFILNLVYAVCGTTFAWSSPVLVKLSHLSDTEGSNVASMVALGSVLGPLVCGAVMDLLGRKGTVALCMALMSCSWMTLTLVSDTVMLSVGRFIAGVSVGIAFSAVPTYIAEISEDSVRGLLNTLSQIFTCSGSLFMYAVGPFVSYATLHYLMLALCGLFFALFPLLPNSPYFLIIKDDIKQAKTTLVWLRGYKSDSLCEKELQLMQETIRQNSEENRSITTLFSTTGNRRALTICCILLWLQQVSGISIIVFYAEKIFQMTGSTISTSTCSIVIGLIMTASGFICPVAVKYFGYKKPLLLSSSGMALGMGGLGVFFLLKFNHFEVDNISWLPLLSVVLYILFFNVGFGNIPWALTGELFPSNVKSCATTIITSSNGLVAFLITNLFPNMVSLLGLDFLFMACSFFCLLGVVFISLVIQDTSGLSFQEIQLILAGAKRKNLKPHPACEGLCVLSTRQTFIEDLKKVSMTGDENCLS